MCGRTKNYVRCSWTANYIKGLLFKMDSKTILVFSVEPCKTFSGLLLNQILSLVLKLQMISDIQI